ncbi:unnamed protein product [Cyclocybe aegerita]|uniref:polynucleotide adenylyltransferase n=1 Tax=Cyclocybe aegerita TaxID=1973307 RepID=A0A8S0VZY7_CYCAE|nr:unnamed protein product [Cyclocybe aegerita]
MALVRKNTLRSRSRPLVRGLRPNRKHPSAAALYSASAIRVLVGWIVVRAWCWHLAISSPNILLSPSTVIPYTMAYTMGAEIKANLMEGRPTRTKSYSDYNGETIPPCGDYAPRSTLSLPRAPWSPRTTATTTTLCATQLQSSLHEEIVQFMEYMKPTSHELAVRDGLVKRFTDLIRSFRMGVAVQPVGSYVTGLFLPTSDIDMVLTFNTTSARSTYSSNYFIKSDLRIILAKIQTSGFASKVVDVLQASVPLIRITDKVTGIDIDLTAADTHGVLATAAVQKWLKTDVDLIKTLITVVKMFLTIRRCGTTYTGGLNSYVLVWMVVAWVKLEWPKTKKTFVRRNKDNKDVDDLSALTAAIGGLSVSSASSSRTANPALTFQDLMQRTEPGYLLAASPPKNSLHGNYFSSTTGTEPDLGHALKGFLKFYGQDFDYVNQAIKIAPTPAYAPKPYLFSRYPTQQYLLSIFDPADTTIDMGSKAYAIKHVKASFQEAYGTIVRLERKGGHQPDILSKVLGGDFTKFVQKRSAMARG